MDAAFSFLKKAASEAASLGGKVIDKASAVAGDVRKMAADLPQFEVEGVVWQAEKALGEGGFGTVYLCTDMRGREAAVKKCVSPNDRVHEARREMDAMKACEGHPNCVQLLGYTQSRRADVTEFILATEFCAGGNLFDAVQKGIISSENDIIRAFAQVCEAVAYMHSRNPPLVHRDLKLANVYLNTHTGKWCLGDFGSVQIGVKEVSRTEVGLVQDEIDRLTTPQYRAPEQCAVQSGVTLGPKIDVWALGVMLYQMAFKRTPWDSTLGTMGGRYRLPDRPKFSDNFNHIFAMVFKLKPEERPTVAELLEYLAAHWPLDKAATPHESVAAPLAPAPRTGSSDGQSSTPTVPTAAAASTPTAPMPSPKPAHARSLSGSGPGVLAVQPGAPAGTGASSGSGSGSGSTTPTHARTGFGSGSGAAAFAAPAAAAAPKQPSSDLFDLLSFDGGKPAAPAAPAAPAGGGATPVAPLSAPAARPVAAAASVLAAGGKPAAAAGPAAKPAGTGPAAASGASGSAGLDLASLYGAAAAPAVVPPTAQMAAMRVSWGAAVQHHGGFTPNYDALDDRPRAAVPMGYPPAAAYGYPGAPPPGWAMGVAAPPMGPAPPAMGLQGAPVNWGMAVPPQPQPQPPARK